MLQIPPIFKKYNLKNPAIFKRVYRRIDLFCVQNPECFLAGFVDRLFQIAEHYIFRIRQKYDVTPESSPMLLLIGVMVASKMTEDENTIGVSFICSVTGLEPSFVIGCERVYFAMCEYNVHVKQTDLECIL